MALTQQFPLEKIDLIGNWPTLGGTPSRRSCPEVSSPQRFGPYQPTGLIGDGGMGRIYRAVHVALGRQVAIKLLRHEFVRDHMAVQRFFNEARLVNKIRHDNIIDIYDFVKEQDGDGRIYYVMELLQGRTLADALRREPVSVARIANIGGQICGALDAVHRAGVVHRDLKPDNVFLCDRRGEADFVKLLDFGIAELCSTNTLQRLPGLPPQTVSGTPAYMAPEVIRCRRADHRADIYALGVMLYEMLTGQRPVDAETVDELLRAHLQHYPPPPSVVAGPTRPVPPELDALVLRCLAKQPERRPSTMREVAEALRRAVTEEECGTATLVELDAPPSRLPPSQARPRRRRWPRLASALALLAAAPVIAGSQVAEIWTAAVGAERARERPAPVVLDPAPLYQEVVPPPKVQKAQLKQLKKKRVRDRNRPRRSRSARARVRGAVVPRVEARRVVAGTVAAAESTRPAADVAPTFSLGLRTTVDPFEEE